MVDRVRAGEVRVDFTGRSTEFQAAARRARSSLRRSQRQLTLYQRVAAATNIQNRALTLGFAAIGTIVSVQALRGLARVSDQSRQLSGRLGLVTETSEELAQTWADLSAVANETSASYGDTIGIYVRLRQALGETTATSTELTEVVRTLNQAVALSGVSGEAARAALTQLGQGFAAGALRGEELNSVLEQTPAIAQAIAAGLNVPIGSLRALAAEGSLTAEAVFGALQRVAADTEATYLALPRTISRAIQELRNTVFDIFRSTDEASRATERIIDAIDTFASVVRDNQDGISRGVASIVGSITALISILDILAITLAGFIGARLLGGFVSAVVSARVAAASLSTQFTNVVRSANLQSAATTAAANATTVASNAMRAGAANAGALAGEATRLSRLLSGVAQNAGGAAGAVAGLFATIAASTRSFAIFTAAVAATIAVLYRLYTAIRDAPEAYRTLEAAQEAATDVLIERRRQLLLTITAETALGETIRESRQQELDLLNQVIAARRLVELAGTGGPGSTAGGLDADISAGGAAFFMARQGVEEFIARAREASIVSQSIALDQERLAQFDPTDPARAALEVRLAGEREFAALVRQQEALLNSRNEEERRGAEEFLAALDERKSAYEDILTINEQLAARAQERANAELMAAGATSADRLIGGIQNDVNAAARANNRASQLSGFEANDPARAALEAELLVLDQLQARYDELNLTILTGSAEQAIAAQAELDRLMMQRAAVQGLARDRGVEAAAAQAAANQHAQLAQQQMELQRLAMDFGNAAGQALETIILQGGSAEDALRQLVVQLLEAIVQATIIRPLVAAITGGTAGLFAGLFAEGGYTGRGRGIVGERGPEFVDFNSPARVYSNDDLRSALTGRGSGGVVQNITYNIESGVNEDGVRLVLAQETPAIASAIRNDIVTDMGRSSVVRQSFRG